MNLNQTELQVCFWLIATSVLRRKKKKRGKKEYFNPFFRTRNAVTPTLMEFSRLTDKTHYEFYGMNVENFEFILNRISSRIAHHDTHSQPIRAVQRLSLTLRYLAGGESQANLESLFRISRSSIMCILREVLQAIVEELRDFMETPDENTWLQNSHLFESKQRFPSCLGVVDGRHVRVCLSGANTADQFCNFKGYTSIILFAIVGPNNDFMQVNYGSSRLNSDAEVFQRSEIGRMLTNGTFTFGVPPPRTLENGHTLPPIMVGDSSLPSTPHLLTPYPEDGLNSRQKLFNNQVSKVMTCAENAFGMLAARWKVFQKPLQAKYVDLPNIIVGACATLHNFVLRRGDTAGITADEFVPNGGVLPGNWRNAPSCFEKLGPAQPSESGESLREVFSTVFASSTTSTGRVQRLRKRVFNDSVNN